MQNIIVGLVAVVLGAFGLINWWAEFGLVLRGLVPFAVIISGFIWIASKYYTQEKTDSDE